MKCAGKDQGSSQEQNVLHLFIGSLTTDLAISNRHQTLMSITLWADCKCLEKRERNEYVTTGKNW